MDLGWTRRIGRAARSAVLPLRPDAARHGNRVLPGGHAVLLGAERPRPLRSLSPAPDDHAAIRRPAACDFAWRPEPWARPCDPDGVAAPASGTAVGPGVRVFHDGLAAAVDVRQVRSTRPGGGIGGALEIATRGFIGRFLSLAVDLPSPALVALTRRHVLRLEAEVDCVHPARLLARLNLRHGPNVAQVLREWPADTVSAEVEFDLAYADFDPARVDKLWLDLILEAPATNCVSLRDVTLTRRLRAEP